MIISKKFGFSFIHNPKVAGTSVRKSIEMYHDFQQEFWHQAYEDTLGRTVDSAHIPYDDLRPHVKEAIAATFVFGFVRHPYDRFFSGWAEFKRQHSDWFPATLEVNDFIQCFMTQANVRYDWRFIHLCPQHYFFYSRNKRIADFVGKHENFQEDWVRVQQIIGLQAAPLNNDRHRETPDFPTLTETSKAILQNVYARDFLLFSYDKPFTALVNSNGKPVIDTHWQRIELIKNPIHLAAVPSTMTAGEKIAHLEKRVAYYQKFMDE